MKRKLTVKEYTYVASMLFGLFFGAGNLIFPVHLGQMAGSNVWQAILGLLITGVGLPQKNPPCPAWPRSPPAAPTVFLT